MTRRPQLAVPLTIIAALTTVGCDGPRDPLSPTPATSVVNSAAARAPADANVLQASSQPITLCHVNGHGSYVLLALAAPAERAHRGHGDAAPGEPIPRMNGFVFDPQCAPVARPATAVTGGEWQIVHPGTSPTSVFTLIGPELVVAGRWYFATQPAPCLTCVPGQGVSLSTTFDNPTPMTFPSIAAGSATLGGVVHDVLAFGGPLRFETGLVTIPPVPSEPLQLVTVSTPFVLSGPLKGYEVLNTREPRLVFDVPVTGHGTARLEMYSGGANSPVLTFYRLLYEFSD